MSDGFAVPGVVGLVFEGLVAEAAVPGEALATTSDGLLVAVGAFVAAKIGGIQAVDIAGVAAKVLVGLRLCSPCLGFGALFEAVACLGASVRGGGASTYAESVLLLVEAVLLLDGCINGRKLCGREVLLALDAFVQRVVRAEAAPVEEVSRPGAASGKTVRLSRAVPGPEATSEHGLQGDEERADLGHVLSLRDGAGGQEGNVGEAEPPKTGTLDVARTVLADKVLSEAGSGSPVEASSRAHVEQGTPVVLLEDQHVDGPDMLLDVVGERLNPLERWRLGSLEGVVKTTAESDTSKSEQSRDSILRVEDMRDARVDPGLDIDASPREENSKSEDVGGSEGHLDASAQELLEVVVADALGSTFGLVGGGGEDRELAHGEGRDIALTPSSRQPCRG
jgi:hypothetical protein